jgi:hypothetical protein
MPKLYFNLYVAARLRERPDYEAINTDLLYFCLLMKANFFAKEVYFQRKKQIPDDQIDKLFGMLTCIRKFMLEFFEIEEPNWDLIQDEAHDSLEELDSLPLKKEETETSLGELASGEGSSLEAQD